jgi:hypothetical protein
MSTLASTPPLALASGEGPGLALGIAQPDVPWTLHAHDLTRGVLLLGGQGSGKTSLLFRLVMHRALSAHTALIVFDMKGSLVERLLRSLPPDIPKRYYDHDGGVWRDGNKRVWYLDLANASFGLTPLEVREGWSMDTLADSFVHIAGLIVGAMKDLFEAQVFQSSQDIITRTVIGTMAIAWWEHVAEHRRRGTRPEDYGFSGSFATLADMLSPSDDAAIARGRDRTIPPNPWHVAAGHACQRIPQLEYTAKQLLVTIPAAVNASLANMATRFGAPANKITPLVAQYAAVRRFVEQRQRLSLQSVVEAHDILIVNPRIELLGEEAPETVTTFLMHMLNAQLNRHLSFPANTRPRLTLAMDEAHRLLTPTVVKMLATHREAGLSMMAATQYFAQIAASLERPAMQQYVRGGIRNLMQTVMVGRIAEAEEAEIAAKSFRTVYESLTRSDPDSQAHIPVDASNITTLPDYRFLVHAITSAHDGPGTQALPVFVSETFPMREIHEIPGTWRAAHLARQHDVFGDPADQPPPPFASGPPAGLIGADEPVPPVDHEQDAADVARASVGHEPDRRPSQPRTGERDEWRDARGADPAADTGDDRVGEAPLSQDVGGARVHRRPASIATGLEGLAGLSPIAMRPTDDPVPAEDRPAPWPAVAQAVRRAAELEALHGLGDVAPDGTRRVWTSEGDDQVREADAAAHAAREAALIRAAQQGMAGPAEARYAAAAAARARKDIEDRFVGQPWLTPVAQLNLSAERLRVLRVLAQLPYSHADLLVALLPDKHQPRTVAKALAALRGLGLVAHAPVRIEGRSGQPPLLFTVTARGREALRAALSTAGEQIPAHLNADRKLPGARADKPLQGRNVAHELSVQLLAGALRHYGGTDMKCAWMTPTMPGGRLEIGMVRKGARDVQRLDLMPPRRPDMALVGYRQSASPVIGPDLSVRLHGTVAGERHTISVLFEVDRTNKPAYNEPKLVAYDHFLAGWYAHLERRFGKPPVRPLVVFVARSEAAARALARRADATLSVGLGLPGHDPSTYLYFGRSHIAFTSLNWLLAGVPYALRVPELPPGVRGSDTPAALELVELLPRSWWPKGATSASRAPRR